MKVCFQRFFIFSVLAFTCSSYGANQPAIMVNSMKAFLETNDVVSFMEATNRKQWSAPVFYSKWHVNNLMSATNRDAAIITREFGKLLAVRVSEFAQTARATHDSKILLKQSLVLCGLADWLNEAEGYGNFLLGVRCLDIAAVAMGRCVADETFPMDTVSKAASRFHPSWMSPSARQRILNREAGSAIFHSSDSDVGKAREHMRLVWQAGRESKLQANITDPELQHELDQRTTRPERERLEMKANVRFFEDEKFMGQGATTESQWDLKRHEEIIRKDPNSIFVLEKMIVFRDTLGGFPKKNGAKYVADAEGSRAFWLAWIPHGKDDESRQIGVVVWEAYRDIQGGVFLDEDTQNITAKEQLESTVSDKRGSGFK